MNLKKVFLKDACPTKVGGQAVLDGIMMKGEDRTAVAIRFPNKEIYMKTEKVAQLGKWAKIPLLRGVGVFVGALVTGTKTLMYSAEILEGCEDADVEEEEQGKFSMWVEKKLGEKGIWNIMLFTSVFLALAFTIGVFILFPTAAVDWMGHLTKNGVILNLVEGVLRILLFVFYVLAISKMKEIHKVFQYHGAEHKCIHCFENGKELTPENCRDFYTLHPRCGTSFLMFVMVISLILFSLLGWPNLLWRISSRLLLIPVIAGLSYELLKWAGRSDNVIVRILSLPGLYLQKLTTAEPDVGQLEVAIAAMKAVMVEPDTDCFEGSVDKDGKPLPEVDEDEVDEEMETEGTEDVEEEVDQETEAEELIEAKESSLEC